MSIEIFDKDFSKKTKNNIEEFFIERNKKKIKNGLKQWYSDEDGQEILILSLLYISAFCMPVSIYYYKLTFGILFGIFLIIIFILCIVWLCYDKKTYKKLQQEIDRINKERVEKIKKARQEKARKLEREKQEKIAEQNYEKRVKENINTFLKNYHVIRFKKLKVLIEEKEKLKNNSELIKYINAFLSNIKQKNNWLYLLKDKNIEELCIPFEDITKVVEIKDLESILETKEVYDADNYYSFIEEPEKYRRLKILNEKIKTVKEAITKSLSVVDTPGFQSLFQKNDYEFLSDEDRKYFDNLKNSFIFKKLCRGIEIDFNEYYETDTHATYRSYSKDIKSSLLDFYKSKENIISELYEEYEYEDEDSVLFLYLALVNARILENSDINLQSFLLLFADCFMSKLTEQYNDLLKEYNLSEDEKYKDNEKIINLLLDLNINKDKIAELLLIKYIVKNKEYIEDNYYIEAVDNEIALRIKSKFLKNLVGENSCKDSLKIEDLDLMSGVEFEGFVAKLFNKLGYSTLITKASNDQGVDVIATKNDYKIAIQAKCYSGFVGNHAIMEAVAGTKYYNSNKCMVVTNSHFTKSAKELAKSNGVELWDRSVLKEKLREM